jgi:transcriptional regulator with XRE-family HTH domain
MKLRTARLLAGLTQAQLAAKAGINQTVISTIESGRTKNPSHRSVIRICRALRVTPSEIAEFRVESDR